MGRIKSKKLTTAAKPTPRKELRSLVTNWKGGQNQKQRLKSIIQKVGTPEEQCLLRMLMRAQPSIWGD